MFGSNDKKQTDNTQINATGAEPVTMPPMASLVTAPQEELITPSAPPLNDSVMPAEPTLPAQPEPVADDSLKTEDTTSTSVSKPAPAVNADEGELFGIKQQVLQSLAPLVHQLEQTAEEKFKTTMMLIQASDNPGLIKDAYDAANAITDEKARAQALLDVVNEINYFTQHNNNQQ